jgi:Flp pilus assembly protein TadD
MPTPDELIARYGGLLAKRPNDELLRFSLGKALYDAGRYADAEEQLRLALAAKPDWMVVTMLLAQCALRRDDAAGAKALYEKALQFAIDQDHEGPEQEIRAALAKL